MSDFNTAYWYLLPLLNNELDERLAEESEHHHQNIDKVTGVSLDKTKFVIVEETMKMCQNIVRIPIGVPSSERRIEHLPESPYRVQWQGISIPRCHLVSS